MFGKKIPNDKKVHGMSWGFHKNCHGKPGNVVGFYFQESQAPFVSWFDIICWLVSFYFYFVLA